jgi:3',5'-cyclic AMP phosphodiesterase CpdA
VAALALGLVGCAGTEPSLRLVFYSDVHARTEWETPVALERVRDAINAEAPDLVIATGDLITDGFEAASPDEVSARWDAYLTLHDGIDAEVYAAIGNHDLVAANPKDGSPPAADPRAVARERLGLDRTWYGFERGGYRFFVLDSTEVTGGELQYRGFIGDDQRAWLEAELAETDPATPLVLALHIPLLTSFYAATEGSTAAAQPNRVVVNNREVLALFEGHNLVLVLQGHLHAKELIRWGDTTFITGGAVSGKWWRGAWFGTEPGYNVVTLRGNRVEWEYVEYGWTPRRPRRH